MSAVGPGWAVVVDGADVDELGAATDGRLRIGAAGEQGTVAGEAGVAVLLETSGDGRVLVPEEGPDPALARLSGPVRLWWPGERGRWEVDGEVDRTGRRPTVLVHWPPRLAQDREHLRARVTTEAWVAGLADAGEATGTVLDLSAGGASVVLPEPPPWWAPGAAVAVCLRADRHDIVAGATVLRVGRTGKLAALRFDAIAAADQDRITALVLAVDARRAAR